MYTDYPLRKQTYANHYRIESSIYRRFLIKNPGKSSLSQPEPQNYCFLLRTLLRTNENRAPTKPTGLHPFWLMLAPSGPQLGQLKRLPESGFRPPLPQVVEVVLVVVVADLIRLPRQ